MMATKVNGVILDLDGTLVNSTEALISAWRDAFKQQGQEFSTEQIRLVMGGGREHLIKTLTGLSPEDSKCKTLLKAWNEILKLKYLDSVKPFPKAPELLQHMKAAGLRLVVAASSNEEMVQSLLKKLDAGSLIEDVTCLDTTEGSKPAPNLVQEALEKLGLEPRAVAMLGDTPYDIQVAAQAHVRTIALRSGGFSDQDLTGAIEIYDNPQDLLEHFDNSTLAAEQPNQRLNNESLNRNETARNKWLEEESLSPRL